MGRLLKIVGILVVIVIIVVGGLAYYVFDNLNELAQSAIETYGSQVTGTAVGLQNADISPQNGSGSLTGLTVGNPPGFETENAIAIGAVRVQLDIGSVTEDPIVINEVAVDGPAVTYEIGDSGSNIDTIRDTVQARAGGASGGDDSTGSGGESADKGPKVVIENLVIRDGRVAVSATGLGGETLDLVLPEVHLTDVGRESGGATPEEIAKIVLAAITDNIDRAIATVNLDELVGGAQDVVEGAAGELRQTLDGELGETGGVADGVGSAVEDGIGAVGDQLEGLFNDE